MKDGEEDRTSRTGVESWRKRTEGGRGLVDNAVETPPSQASASASIVDDVMRRTVTGNKEPAEYQCGYKYYAGNWVTSVFKLMLRMKPGCKF